MDRVGREGEKGRENGIKTERTQTRTIERVSWGMGGEKESREIERKRGIQSSTALGNSYWSMDLCDTHKYTQRVAACCSVWQHVASCFPKLQSVAVCVAACCSVL